jgi:hypothetical protein
VIHCIRWLWLPPPVATGWCRRQSARAFVLLFYTLLLLYYRQSAVWLLSACIARLAALFTGGELPACSSAAATHQTPQNSRRLAPPTAPPAATNPSSSTSSGPAVPGATSSCCQQQSSCTCGCPSSSSGGVRCLAGGVSAAGAAVPIRPLSGSTARYTGSSRHHQQQHGMVTAASWPGWVGCIPCTSSCWTPNPHSCSTSSCRPAQGWCCPPAVPRHSSSSRRRRRRRHVERCCGESDLAQPLGRCSGRCWCACSGGRRQTGPVSHT